MNENVFNQSIAKLCKDLEMSGLPSLAAIIDRAICSRTIAEHDKWDSQTRAQTQDSIIEVLADGVHSRPREAMEITSRDLSVIQNLPPLSLGKFHDASSNSEISALEHSGAIQTDGKEILCNDPGELLTGLSSLLLDRDLWVAQSMIVGCPDLHKAVIQPIKQRLTQAVNANWLRKIALQAARLYGVRVKTVSVKNIYTSAASFIERAGTGTAVTFSTSSGVIDPLERFGTTEIFERLVIDPSSETGQRLHRKHPWRVVNFRDGLLNPSFQARRMYFFDRQITADAMHSTLKELPNEKKEKYLRIAAELVLNALDCPRFELYAVDNFSSWMWRYTRSAPNHVLISLRHPETKSIAEGVELNFKNPKSIHRWYQRVFRLGERLPVPGLAPIVMMAAEAEDAYYTYLHDELLEKDIERDVLAHAHRVKFEESTIENRKAEAYDYITSLAARAKKQDNN